MGAKKKTDGVSMSEIEDPVHNFLILMLEHSMRKKMGGRQDNFLSRIFSVTYMCCSVAAITYPLSVDRFMMVVAWPNPLNYNKILFCFCPYNYLGCGGNNSLCRMALNGWRI